MVVHDGLSTMVYVACKPNFYTASLGNWNTTVKKLELFGIVVCLSLAPGYIYLMYATGSEIDWFVVFFIIAMTAFLTLYATKLRKYTEDTKENKDMALKIIKKAALGSIKDSD